MMKWGNPGRINNPDLKHVPIVKDMSRSSDKRISSFNLRSKMPNTRIEVEK